MSMAAALALGNAELLSGLVIHQLVRRGAPFVYGCGLHHMDMRTTISVYGAPGVRAGAGRGDGNGPLLQPAPLRLRRLHG